MRSRSRRPLALEIRGSRWPSPRSREDFLGPGPWQIVRWGGGYRATPDADPVYLYTDDVIGILPVSPGGGSLLRTRLGNGARKVGFLGVHGKNGPFPPSVSAKFDGQFAALSMRRAHARERQVSARGPKIPTPPAGQAG